MEPGRPADRLAAGTVLAMVYGRCRASISMQLRTSLDFTDDRGYLELRTSTHKAAKKANLKTKPLDPSHSDPSHWSHWSLLGSNFHGGEGSGRTEISCAQDTIDSSLYLNFLATIRTMLCSSVLSTKAAFVNYYMIPHIAHCSAYLVRLALSAQPDSSCSNTFSVHMGIYGSFPLTWPPCSVIAGLAYALATLRLLLDEVINVFFGRA